MASEVTHVTLTFERTCDTPVDRVFKAFADAKERERWGMPSDTAAFIYDSTDFRVGGRDTFRCGNKDDPQFHGVTTYHEIGANSRIVSTETVATGGKTLFVSLITTAFDAAGTGTRITVTTQIASFVGNGAASGITEGQNAALDNLVTYLRRR